jgi:hypothetical protein
VPALDIPPFGCYIYAKWRTPHIPRAAKSGLQ